MSSILKDVGAVAGLASFLGLALLALLYFAQARDIRRLSENASFLVEGGSEDGETVTPAERTAPAPALERPGASRLALRLEGDRRDRPDRADRAGWRRVRRQPDCQRRFGFG